MPICITARYRVRPQFTKVCQKAIQDLVDHVKENEPGILFYVAQQDILDPMRFQQTIIFRDEAALAMHQQSKASARFVSAVYPNTLEPIEFTEHNIIAFKGSDTDVDIE